MKDYRSENVRNLAVLGHNGSGKSSVIQSMMLEAKQIDRIVSAESGQSSIDFEPQEIKRGQTLSLKMVPIEWQDCKINCIDTPGYADFVAETLSGLSVGDNVLIVVDGKNGVDEGTKSAFRWVESENKPTIFFVNKMDDENVSFHTAYETLRETFGKSVIAFEIPIREKGVVIGSINLLSKKVWYYDHPEKPHEVPEEYADQVAIHWEEICEAVAMTDDELMETYFDKGNLSEEDILKGVSLGVRSGDIRPVYCGSANAGIGMRRLLDLITEYFPSYQEKGTVTGKDRKGNEITLRTQEDEVFSAQVFKTIVDPFVGKISYLKVMSGVLSADSEVTNNNQQETETINQVFSINGKYQIGVGKLFSGDIGAVTKLQSTKTFDTLAASDCKIIYDSPDIPQPLLGVTIQPETKKDEDKLSMALSKVLEEDCGARFEKNPETLEQILYGLGDQHLDSLITKLKDKYGVTVNVTEPKVAFRETIRNKVTGEGRHKKQTGGAGQFGHVFIEFEPWDCEEMVYETRVVGGAVPKQFFSSVEQGLREAMVKGVLAGYKVVGVKATLVDGKYHDVDSKEIAFKQAARLAYLDAMEKATVQLLEPIVLLEITVPESFTGTIMGDLNKRRGVILSVDALENQLQLIQAEVPKVEVKKYVADLRSMTQGSGSYQETLVRYDVVPESLVKNLLDNN